MAERMTIGEIAAAGGTLRILCARHHIGLKAADPCGAAVMLDMATMRALYGDEYALSGLERELHCPGCGSTQIRLEPVNADELTSKPRKARSGKPTPYPLPPERTVHGFPATPVLDTAIADLVGLWLKIECDCGRQQLYPLRLLAAKIGWKTTLRTIVPKLRCQDCGQHPRQVALIDRADGDGRVKPRASSIDLIAALRGD
jgi:hypothetical protein